MKKIIPILVIALLTSSAICMFTSSDVSGETEKRTYTNALLPDVYSVNVNDFYNAEIRYKDYNYYSYFPTSYEIYTPETAATVPSNLDKGILPASDYVSGNGPGVLFVFVYIPPSELNVNVNGTQINSNTLTLVREGVSFQFYSGQPVKITLSAEPSSGLYFGLGTWSYSASLNKGENEFTIPAPGDWRIYSYYWSYSSMQMFLSFTIEYEEVSGNTEIYGYLTLVLAAVCIGVLAFSAMKQRIKD